jgi:hypothetical protein
VGTETHVSIQRDAIDRSLNFANLKRSDLKRGSHPDDGGDCLYLEADIREYSAFLVALTIQHRNNAAQVTQVADQVRLQHTDSGDTRFWLPGITVPGL